MGILNSFPVDEVMRRGSIQASDVAALRAAFYQDAMIEPHEARTLFDLNECCPVRDAAWADFFIEAVTDFLVDQMAPEGYVNAGNAEWLIERIGKDGKVDSATELELLVNIIDKARWAPESLVSFALNQVKRAVIKGDGPLRAGRGLDKGCITEGEVELLRRTLYAFGGSGNIAVTRSEAEILFDISDATSHAVNSEAWTELFVKAITNCIMAASGYSVPTREEALHAESWSMRRGELSPVNLLRAMVSAGLGGFRASYSEQTAEERELARLERQRIAIITAEEVTDAEAQWLVQRMERDGKLNSDERALIAYLRQEGRRLHPLIEDLVTRMSKAA